MSAAADDLQSADSRKGMRQARADDAGRKSAVVPAKTRTPPPIPTSGQFDIPQHLKRTQTLPPVPEPSMRGVPVSDIPPPPDRRSGPGSRSSGPSSFDDPARSALPPEIVERAARAARGRRPAPQRARSKLQLIDYSPEEPMLDHKGRSKPLYKPRSPRPERRKPGLLLRVMLGWFPGVRPMVLEGSGIGFAYAILGLGVLAIAVFMLLEWPQVPSRLSAMMIDRRWLLVWAAGIVVALIAYEGLRLASYLEERLAGRFWSRALASLLLPSLGVLVLAPAFLALWPEPAEWTWFGALGLSTLATAASAWCTLEGTLDTRRGRLMFVASGVALMGLLAGGAWLTHAIDGSTPRLLAGFAAAAGFKLLPRLLTF